ncbi:MAG: hypothetical protein WDZ26_01195 [Nitriliruptoraceae bacterium]
MNTTRTRWLLLGPLTGLVVIITGVWWLEAVHPQLDTSPLVVAGVPDLGLDDTPHCIRGVDETAVDTIRERFTPGARVSSSQVVACPMAWDQQQVTYVGEAVGEVLRREGGAWVQLNDDRYALEVGPMIGHREHSGFNSGLAVWLPDGLHERIGDIGRPAQRGDVVLIRGTVHRADAHDGGGLTIRADDLEVLASSVTIDPPLHTLQAAVAAALAALALAASVWARWRRQQR